MALGYFITGTDTGVGKTLVSAALIRAFATQGKKTAGMKPIAAGSVLRDGVHVWEDSEALIAASNVHAPRQDVTPYALHAAIAPHVAAEREGVSIQLEPITTAYARLSALAEIVIVEGAGGLMIPLNEDLDGSQIPLALNLPVILVVGIRLGCLNHALLTQLALQQRGLKFAGWVASRIDRDMNAAEENITSLRVGLRAPLLGVIPFLKAPNPEQALSHLDVSQLA